MNHSSTPVSRHHDYLCQLIQKWERRFGTAHELLNPLRDEAALFDKNAPAYLEVRVTPHTEPSTSVIERMWVSRLQKMHRAAHNSQPDWGTVASNSQG